MQSHFQIVNNSYIVGKRNELNRKHHTICVQVPFFHVFGTTVTINAALNHGATLVIPTPGYNPNCSLDAIRDEKWVLNYEFQDIVSRKSKSMNQIWLNWHVTLQLVTWLLSEMTDTHPLWQTDSYKVFLHHC